MNTKAKIKELENKIEAKESELKSLLEEIENFEINPDKYEESFNDCLDEGNEISIGNLRYLPSQLLKAVDTTAYRCGLLDFCDSIDLDDDEDFCELKEQESELIEEIEALKEKLNQLKNA